MTPKSDITLSDDDVVTLRKTESATLLEESESEELVALQDEILALQDDGLEEFTSLLDNPVQQLLSLCLDDSMIKVAMGIPLTSKNALYVDQTHCWQNQADLHIGMDIPL